MKEKQEVEEERRNLLKIGTKIRWEERRIKRIDTGIEKEKHERFI